MLSLDECDSVVDWDCPSGVVVLSDRVASWWLLVVVLSGAAYGAVVLPLCDSERSWLRVTVVPSGYVDWFFALWCLVVVCCALPY